MYNDQNVPKLYIYITCLHSIWFQNQFQAKKDKKKKTFETTTMK